MSLKYVEPDMIVPDRRRLSVEEAAEVIYQTAEPTPQQISKVRSLIERGILAGSIEGRANTTAESVAKYLAMAALRKGPPAKQADGKPRSRVQRENDADMRPLYREVMSDYFLAVLRRRDARRQSKTFQRAVWAGQILIVVTVFAFCVWISTREVRPTEVSLVEDHLQKKDATLVVDEWFPPTNAGKGFARVRVRYHFEMASGSSAIRDEIFTLKESKVVSSTPSPITPKFPKKSKK